MVCLCATDAEKCQDCHMPDGNHENRTAWGFLGVRLPLPEDKQWAADQVTILKALGVLNPETGEPTARLEAVKAVDLARLTEEAWITEREMLLESPFFIVRPAGRTYLEVQVLYTPDRGKY